MFNSSNGIWSGAQITAPIGQFFWIEANWTVPGVFAFPDSPSYSAAAVWVGLDNSGTDLYQSGTDSECWGVPLFGWTFTNYWMWIESLPFAPWGLPNFPVSPGDQVGVDILVADQNGQTWFQDGSNGGLTPADNSVWFFINNFSTSQFYWGYLPTAAVSLGGSQSSGFTGTTAEFILERPTNLNSNSPFPLAAFGVATMDSCWYGDAQYGTNNPFPLDYNGLTPFDGTLTYLTMQNGSDVLALPFSFPDPTSSEGYLINWLWVNYQ